MTPAPIPGYLTKKEVEERYGRSHRSLTRDFSAAVRTKDVKVLPHLKLQTEDGTVRQGSEVTLEQIQKLSNQGQSPTWFVEGEWAAERYGSRPAAAAESAVKKSQELPDQGRSTGDRAESGELVHRLEERIKELQKDKEKLYNELSIKNEQIQQANDRTRESNVLMKELQTLLGNVQARALLPLPAQPNMTARDGVIDSAEHNPTPQSTKPKARTEKGSARSKGRPTPAPTKSEPVVTAAPKAKWYEMPTLGRLVSRRK